MINCFTVEGTGMVLNRGVLLCLVTAAAIGCSSAFLQGVAQGLAASSPASAGAKLMVSGGPGHKTYLGCLSCSRRSVGVRLPQRPLRPRIGPPLEPEPS